MQWPVRRPSQLRRIHWCKLLGPVTECFFESSDQVRLIWDHLRVSVIRRGRSIVVPHRVSSRRLRPERTPRRRQARRMHSRYRPRPAPPEPRTRLSRADRYTPGARATPYNVAIRMAPDKGGGLFALSLETGEVLWHTPHPGCDDAPSCDAAQSAAVTAIREWWLRWSRWSAATVRDERRRSYLGRERAAIV